MKYKVGIIGYGKMGMIRHNAIREIASGEVMAISEPNLTENPDNLPNVSNEEIIHNKDIDAIFVCTPNYLNKDLSITNNLSFPPLHNLSISPSYKSYCNQIQQTTYSWNNQRKTKPSRVFSFFKYLP